MMVKVSNATWCSTGQITSAHDLLSDNYFFNIEVWCLLWSAPEQTVEQIIELPVIWVAMVSKNDDKYKYILCFLKWIQSGKS